MSLYATRQKLDYLTEVLTELRIDGISYADDVSRAIADMIYSSTLSGIDASREYTDNIETNIKNDVDNSLNYMSDYVARADDLIKDQVNERISAINARFDSLEATGGGSSDDEIEEAYNSIAETHNDVSDYLTDTLETVSGAMGNIYEFSKDAVTKSVDFLSNDIVSLVMSVIDMPGNLIAGAMEMLLPAMSEENVHNAGKIIASGEVKDFVVDAFGSMKDMYKDILHVDEADFKEWMKKGMQVSQEISDEAMA